MSGYDRRGRKDGTPVEPKIQRAAGGPEVEPGQEEKKGIRVNGFQQVVDMLRAADPAFRESLLKRLLAQDRTLVEKLRRVI